MVNTIVEERRREEEEGEVDELSGFVISRLQLGSAWDNQPCGSLTEYQLGSIEYVVE